MTMVVFASSLVFFIWLTYMLGRNKKGESEREEGFWERERRANSTRRQPLDDLDYINIPFDELPLDLMADDEKVAEYRDVLRTLAENPIVNLSCISNTDLKLRYGAPNITLLSRYDAAYTTLARTLQQWAARLHGEGYVDEARVVLEFAVRTGTDINATYLLLADIYRTAGEAEKVGGLIEAAGKLETSLGKGIAQKLAEYSN